MSLVGIAAEKIFDSVTLWLRSVCRIIGTDVIDPNFKMDFCSLVSIVVLIIVHVMSCNTVFFYWSNYMFIAKASIIFGVVWQVCILFDNLMGNPVEIYPIFIIPVDAEILCCYEEQGKNE